jgi:hypothetical protein
MEETPTTQENAVQSGLEHLERIETELEEIKERTNDPKRSLLNGMLSGAGAIVGSILALVLLGFALSLLGFIPGLGEITNYLHTIVDRFNSRY